MSETKFTKGPWKVFKYTASDGEIYVRVQTEYNVVENGENIGPETICTIGGYPTIPLDGGAEWEATGNLIAAAPDMYEALEFQCKNCLGRYSISKDSNECAFYIRRECMIAKALRKARGEAE
jgi:hypothetical protein